MPLKTPSLPGPLGSLSRLAGGLRFAYMPLGLAALVAVGVHAAADTLDDRVLGGIDWLDTILDGFFASHPFTEGLVDALGAAERTRVARALTLLWELAADVVLVLPMFGYAEEDPLPAGSLRLVARPRWRELARLMVMRPGTLRTVRPLFTGAVVVAGACSLAQLVQASATLSLRGPLGAAASTIGQGAAIAALVAILASFGTRAVLRALEHAHERTEARALTPVSRLRMGLVGTLLVLPLAVAAALDASPILSFLR